MRLNYKKIKIIMIEKDMTVKELSKTSGLSYTLLSSIRCGKSCSPRSAKAIAKGLDVSVSEILIEKGSAINGI